MESQADEIGIELGERAIAQQHIHDQSCRSLNRIVFFADFPCYDHARSTAMFASA